MTIEELATELHKDYRAAGKSLNGVFLHDHGWTNCRSKDYFRQRAARKLAAATEDFDKAPAGCAARAAAMLGHVVGPGPYTCKDCGQQYVFYHPPCAAPLPVDVTGKYLFMFAEGTHYAALERASEILAERGIDAVVSNAPCRIYKL